MRSQIIFIFLEVVCGLGLAILGSYIYMHNNNDYSAELFGAIFGTFLIGYLGVIVGVACAGYFHLIYLKRVSLFKKAVFSSIGWLILLLIGYLALNIFPLPNFIESYLLPTLMPLAGAVIGFNYIIRRAKSNQYHKTAISEDIPLIEKQVG